MFRRVYNGPAPVVESARAKGEPGEVLIDWDVAVDLESAKYHCNATILFGSRVTNISEKVAAPLGAHFTGVQVTFLFERHAKVRVADGVELPLARRTGRVSVTDDAVGARGN